MNALKRWALALVRVKHYAEDLNARVAVENTLFNVASGRRPLLSPEECRQLALKLGVPMSFHRKVSKQQESR